MSKDIKYVTQPLDITNEEERVITRSGIFIIRELRHLIGTSLAADVIKATGGDFKYPRQIIRNVAAVTCLSKVIDDDIN